MVVPPKCKGLEPRSPDLSDSKVLLAHGGCSQMRNIAGLVGSFPLTVTVTTMGYRSSTVDTKNPA